MYWVRDLSVYKLTVYELTILRICVVPYPPIGTIQVNGIYLGQTNFVEKDRICPDCGFGLDNFFIRSDAGFCPLILTQIWRVWHISTHLRRRFQEFSERDLRGANISQIWGILLLLVVMIISPLLVILAKNAISSIQVTIDRAETLTRSEHRGGRITVRLTSSLTGLERYFTFMLWIG